MLVSLGEKLKTVALGIGIGERKGKDFIPSHSLALSCEINREAFINHAVSYAQAVAYLRKEAITLDEAPRGFILLTYCNEPIGFVKNIGNRANNLYPHEWRIRSGYLPETSPEILIGQPVD
jgi:NOL1/NOP2/fmu family ribosome biogenesis protein